MFKSGNLFFTIVAACNNALTGVGAFIASEAKHVNQIDLIYLPPINNMIQAKFNKSNS
jgi:hypothetical protein